MINKYQLLLQDLMLNLNKFNEEITKEIERTNDRYRVHTIKHIEACFKKDFSKFVIDIINEELLKKHGISDIYEECIDDYDHTPANTDIIVDLRLNKLERYIFDKMVVYQHGITILSNTNQDDSIVKKELAVAKDIYNNLQLIKNGVKDE